MIDDGTGNVGNGMATCQHVKQRVMLLAGKTPRRPERLSEAQPVLEELPSDDDVCTNAEPAEVHSREPLGLRVVEEERRSPKVFCTSSVVGRGCRGGGWRPEDAPRGRRGRRVGGQHLEVPKQPVRAWCRIVIRKCDVRAAGGSRSRVSRSAETHLRLDDVAGPSVVRTPTDGRVAIGVVDYQDLVLDPCQVTRVL